MKVKTNYANAPVWREVNVKSRIPEPLKMLGKMARNIWWAWNDEATEMFRELDPELWQVVGQNPVALLERLSYEKLEALSADSNVLHEREARFFSSFCSLFLYGIWSDSRIEDLFWRFGYLGW